MTASEADEEVTGVGFPPPPIGQQDSYFAQCVAKMAELITETRAVHVEVKGYRNDLAEKAQLDASHWATVQHEISSVRDGFENLRKELENFRTGLRDEVASARRDSEGQIRLLEERIGELERTVAELDAKIKGTEDGQEHPGHVTLVQPPDGAAPKTATG